MKINNLLATKESQPSLIKIDSQSSIPSTLAKTNLKRAVKGHKSGNLRTNHKDNRFPRSIDIN